MLASFASVATLLADDSSISRDEEVVTYPSYAYRESGQWVVPIHGLIRERESNSLKRRAMLSQIEKAFRSRRAVTTNAACDRGCNFSSPITNAEKSCL